MEAAVNGPKDKDGKNNIENVMSFGYLIEERRDSPCQHSAVYCHDSGIKSSHFLPGSTNYSKAGKIESFGLPAAEIDAVIDSGRPFETSGCTGNDGRVACNRPFGNCLPDVKQWNYPYPPDEEELDLIQRHIFSSE